MPINRILVPACMCVLFLLHPTGAQEGNGVHPMAEAVIFSDDFERDPRKTHPFRIGILAAQANRFSMAELRHCWRTAEKAHIELVSTSVSQPMTLELLLINMLS